MATLQHRYTSYSKHHLIAWTADNSVPTSAKVQSLVSVHSVGDEQALDCIAPLLQQDFYRRRLSNKLQTVRSMFVWLFSPW